MSNRNDNSGTLGANKRKEKESHPSHTAQCTIDGVAYWISAWVKEGPTGKFFSLAFKPKDNGNAVAKAKHQSRQPETDDEFDSEVPF